MLFLPLPISLARVLLEEAVGQPSLFKGRVCAGKR